MSTSFFGGSFFGGGFFSADVPPVPVPQQPGWANKQALKRRATAKLNTERLLLQVGQVIASGSAKAKFNKVNIALNLSFTVSVDKRPRRRREENELTALLMQI